MIFYFLFIRIAALLGHRKARLLVRGQAETIPALAAQSQPAAGKGPVWIHAASAGEFEQARPLIERIKAQHPQQKIVVTFFSPSGYELRKDYGLADGVYYLPFATRRNAKRFLNALQPRMAFFIKYEFWPAYIRELKKRDIPSIPSPLSSVPGRSSSVSGAKGSCVCCGLSPACTYRTRRRRGCLPSTVCTTLPLPVTRVSTA